MFEAINRRLEKFFINITSWIHFFKKEKVYGRKGISFKKLDLLKKGFYSDRLIPYDFQNNLYSDYVSDIETIKLGYVNHPYGRLLRNKLVFSNFFNTYFKTPVCYCIINKGEIEPVNSDTFIDSFKCLIELIQRKKLILKPLLGTAGQGIILLEQNGSGLYINKKLVENEELKNLIKTLDVYLVSEFIEQGKFSGQFFPDTTNTIRITTISDPEKVTSFMPYSFMRFGRQKTIPADNISLGGLFSMINVDTGELSPAYEIKKNEKIKLHKYHPDTNVLIDGVKIPGWTELKNFFIKTGGIIKPFIKIVGWDIILTNDSFAVIEGNNGPDLYMQGASYPFAKIPEVNKFLKYHKIR